jgi:hypothetical protein
VNIFRKLLILFISVLLAAVLTSCSAASPNRSSDASLTLRTYTVPNGDAEALSSALNHVLGLDNYQHDIGRTYWSGPGQVLVLAPAPLQNSIADSLKEMVGRNSSATSAGPLRLNAWIVDVYQGMGALDPNLKAIQPALQSFEEDAGPAHFTQRHYFSEVSDPGAETAMSPLPYYFLNYSISGDRDRLMLKFDYRHRFIGPGQGGVEMLSGQVTTQLRQTLVLGVLAGPSAGDGGNSKMKHAAADAEPAGLRYKLLVIRIVPAT